MGSAIAARLMEVGHQVTVWNRTAEKTKPLVDAGAKVAATPADLTNGCAAVITMLTGAAAIDAVYNGPSGLLSANPKGKLFIEMSTVAPKVETDLAPKVRAKGAALVECPVGGSTAPARKGQLLGLMGAEPADAEAFAIARQVGWEPKRLLDLFVESNGANKAFAMRADMIVSMFENRDPGPTTFSIANGVKDLRTIIETGEAAGADMRVTKAALTGFEEATKNGFGGGDGARMAVYWSSQRKKS